MGPGGQDMRLKSYFTPTVEAALRMARAELGENAMLVQSRKASAEAQHLGSYEVVFAVDEGGARRPVPGRPPGPGDSPAAVEILTRQVMQLRRQVERLADTLNSPPTGAGTAGQRLADPAGEDLYRELVRADVAPDLARRLAERAAGEDPACPASRHVLARALETLVSISPRLGAPRKDAERARVAALVGPAGAGKTSMLIKLAARYGLGARRSCQLLSADTSRIGAAEELRSYAAILGVGCEIHETVRALEHGIEECRRKHLILIDTPGFGGKDLGPGQELAEFLASQPEIDVHLVLPATARAADLKRMLERFAAFEPDQLIFTRLDECTTSGGLLTAAAESGLPISFLSDGQTIPDDFAEASALRLAGALLPPGPDAGVWDGAQAAGSASAAWAAAPGAGPLAWTPATV
jgi:flagellar biosynthesis protein FlhF